MSAYRRIMIVSWREHRNNNCVDFMIMFYKKLIRRWDSERELFTTTSYT